MSADLSRDPVFGAVARALNPRGAGRAGDSTRMISAHVAAGRLAAEDRAILSEAGCDVGSIPRALAPAPYEWILATERAPVVALAERHEVVRAVLAASDATKLAASAPRMMGIVNVTPDSFSDGGNHIDPGRAIEHGLRLVEEGADILDVGGESTRPGSEPIDADEELRRIKPVIAGLARATKTPISIDTMKGAVARAALDAGATIVNDVTAGRFDPALIDLVANRGAGFVVMHMRGDPRTMQQAPHYDDLVDEVTGFLRERCALALEAGVERSKLWIDPGIGFGKGLEHNLELIRRLPELRSLGRPICLGVSRKSFIDKVTQRTTEPHARIGGSAAALVIGVLGGAEILRVHDVAVMREAVLVARAIAASR